MVEPEVLASDRVLHFSLVPLAFAGQNEFNRALHCYADLALVAGAGAHPHAWADWSDASPVRVNGLALALPPGVFELGDGPRCILRFAGPIEPGWRETLARLAWTPRFECPDFGMCADRGGDLDELRKALPLLRGIQPYTATLCTRAGGARVEALPHTLDAVVFSEEDRSRLMDELTSIGLSVISSSRYKLRISADRPIAMQLRDAIGVKIADPGALPRVASVSLGRAIGAPPADATVTAAGAGELIAFADTGLGSGDPASPHPDLAGRVEAILSWPISDAWSGIARSPGADDGGVDRGTGHGTHVVGLACGNGSESGGRFTGVAPQARILMQAIEQYVEPRPEWRARLEPGFYLAGRPLDLRELLDQAYAAGARIHANAWGVEAHGAYTDDAWECDHFLHAHPDMLVIVAAGNSGHDRNRDGAPDPGSLYAPASAKNVLSVGATEGPDVGIGLRGGWAALDPAGTRFPDPNQRTAQVSGQAERLALLSSCGPTLDGRIKPELCAPGTNLAATRSTATAARGWGLASPLPWYQYLGGTSMATGVVAGAAAVVRQTWRIHLGHAPSGAALKALLIFGVRPVRKRDNASAESRQHAGFGRLWLADSLPGPDGPTLLESGAGLATGMQRTLHWQGPGRLRAVLCWYDAPGEALINDLDLVLLDALDNTVAWGNHTPGETGAPDRVNNVECIDRELGAGTWTVQIRAVNVPLGPQSWALAISPGLIEGSAPLPVPSPTTPVRWHIGLGWAAINGVGPQRAAQLEQLLSGGIANLANGQIDPANLSFLPRAVQKRLIELNRFLSQPPPPEARLALAHPTQRFEHGAPAGIAAHDWERLVTALAPLFTAFDRSIARTLCGEALFH